MKKLALNHVDKKGQARMVDVGAKAETARYAKAQGSIRMKPSTMKLIMSGEAHKGDVLGTARLAGIQATKKTSDIIPLCHPLSLTSVTVDFHRGKDTQSLVVTCAAEAIGRTGVEMEALTGASVALLTIYDMCKAADREMCIDGIALIEKRGGKSGHFLRKESAKK
jgi:cyclic pyranopterin phosphate synthase